MYRCRGCSRLRQSGEVGVYVFDVPPIDRDDWKREPYTDRETRETYERRLSHHLKTADRTTRDEPCRVAGCSGVAVRFSVFCFDHHRDGRPTPPPGRMLSSKHAT